MIARLGFCIFLIVAFFVAGCVTAPPKEDVILIWPNPPEIPKIAYLTSYYGEANFAKKSFIDTLLGDDELNAGQNLVKPYGVSAFNDIIYVTDTIGRAVFCINTKERLVTILGNKDLGGLSVPAGVAPNSDGIVFASDAKQKKVFGYDKSGSLKVAIGKKDEFGQPGGMSINHQNQRIYIADAGTHNVHVYSTKGDLLFSFGKRGKGDGEFNYPSNTAIDRRNGNVCVADTQNFRVQCFDKDGKFIRKFGEIGNQPGSFSRPKGIGIDSEGNIYVVDTAFDNFQVFDEKGELLIFIGGAGMEPGRFSLPTGIYVDENDKIYVVDSANRKVQVFQYLSEKWKKEHPEELKKYLLK